ncbi:MAG: protein-L-isoaspartate O-methyltransferase [Pseudomonadota bacterium]
MNFVTAREKMVDCQVRPSDVTHHELLAAMLTVPREEFVEDEARELAYLDRDLEITGQGSGDNQRFMISAAPLSKLMQLAAPTADNVALVVGTGNGYACAVLSLLVSSVVGIEEDQGLREIATDNLSRLGYDNVAVLAGELSEGCEREAPYDVIFVEGAVNEISQHWLDQLDENGRLVAVVGEGNSAKATLFKKTDGIIGNREVFNCAIPTLPGFRQEAGFTF